VILIIKILYEVSGCDLLRMNGTAHYCSRSSRLQERFVFITMND
jgi:hypothetical protein